MTQPLRILLVDDHRAMRNSLKTAIAAHPDLLVVAEAATGGEVVPLVEKHRPDVLVLDLRLPDANGWVLLERLATTGSLPPTLVLSACDEQVYARRLIRAGARGYLMKDEPTARIIESIRLVHSGWLVASHAITSQLMQEALGKDAPSSGAEEPPPPAAEDDTGSALSDRELQIFTLLAQGWRNKDMAAKIGVSEKSISTYKTRLMRKLGLRSTLQLADYYRAHGTALSQA